MLSICIPTLNRPGYFLECLRSIEKLFLLTQDIELCISNNNSDLDYGEAESLVELFLTRGWCVSYTRQNERIPLDQHMHFVISMARGTHCLLLGDDDLVVPEDVVTVQSWLKIDSPDLIVCNSHIIDEQSNVIGELPVSPGKFDNVSASFLALRDKCSFGAVIVKKNLYDDSRFERLYGSSHAYGSFWFSLLDSPNAPCNIVVSDERITHIRKASKNYDYLTVYFRDIFYEYSIYDRWIQSSAGRRLNSEYHQNLFSKLKSIRFLLSVVERGYTFSEVTNVRPELALDYIFGFKFVVSYVTVKLGLPRIYHEFRGQISRWS
ncbi:glycosyltransferase [Luminiphilus sp.]|nr:glycosyltransferase [Luminiphilus sp.]